MVDLCSCISSETLKYYCLGSGQKVWTPWVKKFGFDRGRTSLGRRSLDIWQHTSFIRKVDEKTRKSIFPLMLGKKEKQCLRETVIGCKDSQHFHEIIGLYYYCHPQ